MKKIFTILIAFLILGLISAQQYTLKGKLICDKERCKLIRSCKHYSIVKAFKFEIISTSYPTDSKYIIAMVECPKEFGNNFFRDGSTYDLKLIPKSTASFSWIIINDYEKENLLTLWVSTITQSLD